jgi:hypothetical protein
MLISIELQYPTFDNKFHSSTLSEICFAQSLQKLASPLPSTITISTPLTELQWPTARSRSMPSASTAPYNLRVQHGEHCQTRLACAVYRSARKIRMCGTGWCSSVRTWAAMLRSMRWATYSRYVRGRTLRSKGSQLQWGAIWTLNQQV